MWKDDHSTLRLIAGLEEVSGGDIGERKVNDLPPKDRNIPLYPTCPSDNMAFPLRVRKVPKPELDKRGAEVLDAGEFSIDVASDIADLVGKNAAGPEVILAKKQSPRSIEAPVYVVEPIRDSVIVDANVRT